MKNKFFSSKMILCLVLLGICQFWVLVLPVNGLAWESTSWISDGGQYSRGSGLDPGDRWYVEWDVLQGGNGKIDVYFKNTTSDVVHTILQSAGGSYELIAETNGTHWATFKNPSDGGDPIQVYVLTNNKGPGIVPGFNLILIISLLGLLILFIYRKTKFVKI